MLMLLCKNGNTNTFDFTIVTRNLNNPDDAALGRLYGLGDDV